MRECPKCQSMQIEEGFIVDHGYGEKHVAAFNRGAPDKKWWGLKSKKQDRLAIATYRCTRCGYLESYAK